MKNLRMSTKITAAITTVIIICITLLYVIASNRMNTMMKQSEMDHMKSALRAQTNLIEEYVNHQEDTLIAYSKAPVVINFLKNPENAEAQKLVQDYTEKYFADLNQWEGLYVAEWNSHVIAHSDSAVVGMTTREGEGLKALQDSLTTANGIYNAGIIISPASQKLVLSMYCPVFDTDGKTILGYVGGGPFADVLKALLDSMKVSDSDTTNYSMLNINTGMYIFDADQSLMATEVKDPMLLEVMDIIRKNDTVLYGEQEYSDQEQVHFLSSYEYMAEHGWAVVSYDSEANIYKNAKKNIEVLRVLCIITVIIISGLSWILIHLSTRPLKYVENAIMQLKNLNLKRNHHLDSYINKKSEIGQIATAIDSLYSSFQQIVLTLDKCSASLTDSAVKMTDSSAMLMQCVEDNSAVTTEFADHTESITQTVHDVDE
ncbi:MAG: methyl-accepting chemotaxis protein, partial [Eubacterium sp.]|nr:methyl-accepting chemotaxis protein [Eubacterium sp.]